MLNCYLQQSDQRSASCLLWDLDIHNSDITAIQRAYHTILHFATKWNIGFADHCLLKMLGRIHHTVRSAGWSIDYIAFHMILSTMAMNTPIDIFHHCIFPTSKVKAAFGSKSYAYEPFWADILGFFFFKKRTHLLWPLQVKDYDSNASRAREDGAILMLPASLSYLNSHTDGDGRFAEFLEPNPIFYCGLLLGNHGFSTWKSFVTRSISEEDFSDFAPTSVKEAIIYFSGTLLGKFQQISMHMVSNPFRGDFCSPARKALHVSTNPWLFIENLCPSATLGETDLEILHLMNHPSAEPLLKLTICGERRTETRFSKFDTHDAENVEITERRKALFRENIPVDSKLCANTALQYCYKMSLFHWNSFDGIALLIVSRFLINGFDPEGSGTPETPEMSTVSGTSRTRFGGYSSSETTFTGPVFAVTVIIGWAEAIRANHGERTNMFRR
ncbi:hypothetical protein EJB05_02950, partial [Eragrostis curvula]